MGMNKVRGNMYSSKHVTHTWNPLHGTCVGHACWYCYMERYQKPGEEKKVRSLVFDNLELYTHLGSGNTIFVGSSIDLWADNIPSEWIVEVLNHCALFTGNHYLFQSKNPKRFLEFSTHPAMKHASLATTIETNRWYEEMGQAPKVQERAEAMARLHDLGAKTVVTVEPLMKFDLDELVSLVRQCSPEIVHIGTNTHPNVTVPEPTKEEALALIEALKEFTEVDIKDNLKQWLKVR